MSADNWTHWTHCPVCRKRLDEEINTAQVALAEAYGKISAEEWMAQQAEVNALIASRGKHDYDESKTCTFREDYETCTFREDYEIYGAKEGTVIVSYSGNCRECKTSVNFKYEHPFFPEPS